MEGGAAEAGNYKGVMLCNRPTEPTSAAQHHLSPAVDAPSFRPVGLPAEPLGLNPAKENLVSNVLAVHDEASRRRAAAPGPERTNFLNRHKAWLHEMGQKKAELNRELQESAAAAEAKRAKFVAYTKSLRKAVRARAAELDEMGLPHAEPALHKSEPPAAQPAYAPPPAMPPPPPAAKPGPSKAPAAPSKPAWAMTEEEADEMEDAEALALVDFAKDLDYDSYIDDLEVRQALQVIRERIDTQKALEAVAANVEESEDKIAAAGGDWRAQFLAEWNDDAKSTASKRAPIPGLPTFDEPGATGKPEWDASTNAGDKRDGVSGSARAMAEQLLAADPDLKAKHSVKSLASIVDKQSGTKQLTEDELPPLRVVTIVENPRVPAKEVDASNLPYLHRNPAV